MPPPLQPPTLPVRPGDFHRLGLVTDRPAAEVAGWFTTVLGAVPNTSAMPAVRGYPRFSEEAPPDGGESGATAEVLWVGPSPVAVFVPAGENSPLTGFLSRYGPGIHSVAWSVDDIWTVESLLRRHGVRITGTDIEGRHMFMHPKDSAGILVEWTDTEFAEDPRHGPDPVGPTGGAVPVRGLARVTAVVRDLDASLGVLGTLLDVEVSGPRPGDFPGEETADLAIFDLVLRLVTPRSPDSRWSAFLEAGGERLASLAWAVDDLAETEARLRDAGIRVTERAGSVLLPDPADTLGLQMEWTQAS
jgi:methylmalonyl-CoA/ethylmalonyl-CoA epimerase